MRSRIILILVIEVLYLIPSNAYQAQELINIDPDIRLVAAKHNSYPALEQLEHLLYPSQKFHRENPGLRLERLEIAVFGVKQLGNVPERLHKLQSEVENWQIANTQVAQVNHYRSKQLYSGTIGLSRALNQPRKRDYDYLNYRLLTPIIQNVGRQSVSTMFRKKK